MSVSNALEERNILEEEGDEDEEEEGSDDGYTDSDDNVDEMGLEIEDDYFSNPYVFDPVITEDTPIAADVQGSKGNRKTIFMCLP